VLLFGLVLARTVRRLDREPLLNWDLVPAVALALEWSEDDPVEVHRKTYEHLRAELPSQAYSALTAPPGVIRGRFQDPAAFAEHLPFYRARVLYSLSLAGLSALGAPLAPATWRLALAAFVLAALVVLLWTWRLFGPVLGTLAALAIAHLPAALTTATFSSADGLGAFLVLLGAWLLIERRTFAAGAAVLTLSLGARPDGIVLIGFLGLAWLALVPTAERPTAKALGGWIGLSALVYLGLSRFAGEYGWWPLFQISFQEKALHPAELGTSIQWSEYLAVLGRQLGALPGDGYVFTGRGVTGSTAVFFFGFLAITGLALWSKSRARGAREAAWLAALLATYLVRWLLFPQVWDRFFAPFYALVPLCLAALVRQRLTSGSAPESPGTSG
jgi:hypothetical protein